MSEVNTQPNAREQWEQSLRWKAYRAPTGAEWAASYDAEVARLTAERDALRAALAGSTDQPPAAQSEDEKILRRMLAFAYSGSGRLYGDDGELQDASEFPWIDYVRDSVKTIKAKINERGLKKMVAVGTTP
jgi:hypothetical protein